MEQIWRSACCELCNSRLKGIQKPHFCPCAQGLFFPIALEWGNQGKTPGKRTSPVSVLIL